MIVLAALLFILWMCFKIVAWFIPKWLRDPSSAKPPSEAMQVRIGKVMIWCIAWFHQPKGMTRQQVHQSLRTLELPKDFLANPNK